MEPSNDFEREYAEPCLPLHPLSHIQRVLYSEITPDFWLFSCSLFRNGDTDYQQMFNNK